MSSPQFHCLRVSQVEPEGEDALCLSFEVPGALAQTFAFAPGQYLTLRQVGHELRRSYSICSAPGHGLRVGVRKVPGGAFSSRLHECLQPGDVLEVMPPDGHFGRALALQADAAFPLGAQHVLCVAGGSGITPMMSILHSVLDTSPTARCTLVYANRTASSTMFKEELEDLKNRYLQRLAVHWVYSREQVDSLLASGRLDAHKMSSFLRLAGGATSVDHAFICGPHAMNEAVERALLAEGLAPARIHIERFGMPPTGVSSGRSNAGHAFDAAQRAQEMERAAHRATVHLVRDGVTRSVAYRAGDANIFDAALRAGIDLPYSCKSGVCATCRAKVLQGQVRMERNFALEKRDLDAGFVLACQAQPLTPEVQLSFDHR